MEVWNDSATMNMPHVLYANIMSLPYFKRLTRLRTYHEVLHEIDSEVHYLEPWVPGTQVPSTAMCLMFKLFTLKLTENQATDMLDNSTEPFIRATAILYLRFTCPPPKMWDWFYAYIDDPQPVQITKSGTRMTLGELTRELIAEQRFCSVILPRIPAKEKQGMLKEIEQWDRSQGQTGPPGALKTKGSAASAGSRERPPRRGSRENGGRKHGSRGRDREDAARRGDLGRSGNGRRGEYDDRRRSSRDDDRRRERGYDRGSRDRDYDRGDGRRYDDRGSRARDYDRGRGRHDMDRDRYGDRDRDRDRYADRGRDYRGRSGERYDDRRGDRYDGGGRERCSERGRRDDDRDPGRGYSGHKRSRTPSPPHSPSHPRARRRTRSPSPSGPSSRSPAYGSPALRSPTAQSPVSPSSHPSPQRKKANMEQILAQYGSKPAAGPPPSVTGDDSLGSEKIVLGAR